MPFTSSSHRDLAAIAEIDWARLAAYIDGEGCISIKTVHGKRPHSRRVMYVNVDITNTDIRLAAWLFKTFGGSVIGGGDRKNQKWTRCVKWNVASKYAVALLERSFQYFVIKRDQVEVVSAFQSTILPDRRYGRKGRPQEVIDRQVAFKEQLHQLKGTSSRNRRVEPANETIQ